MDINKIIIGLMFFLLIIPIASARVIWEGDDVGIEDSNLKIMFSKEDITCNGYYFRQLNGDYYQKCDFEIKISPKKFLGIFPNTVTISSADIDNSNIFYDTEKNELTNVINPIIYIDEEYQTNINEYNHTCLDSCSIDFNESCTDNCIISSSLEDRTRRIEFLEETSIDDGEELILYSSFYVPNDSYQLFDWAMNIEGDEYYIPAPTWNTSTQADWDLGTYVNTTSISAGYVHLNSTPFEYDSSMVALWHMEETSGVIVDSSGNGNNGTYNGNLYAQDGICGKALGFDGINDYISLGTDASLDVYNAPYTISAWIYLNSGISDQTIFTSSLTDNGGMRLMLKTHLFLSGDNIDLSKSAVVNQPVGYIFNNSEWYHIVAVQHYSGGSPSNASFYVNGGYIGTYVDTNNYQSASSQTKTIGRPNTSWGSFLNGKIDEMAIYNKTLNASEIAKQYRKEAGYYLSTIEDAGESQYWEETMTWDTIGVNGTNIIKFQVRSCDDALCSGETFVGGDNTTGTYFNTSPANLENLTLDRYFQFKSYFERNYTGNPQLWETVINSTDIGTPDLVGVVVNALGNPILNAIVYIINQDTNTLKATVTTNATGGFSYNPPSAGNYTVVAYNPSNISQGGDVKPFIDYPNI